MKKLLFLISLLLLTGCADNIVLTEILKHERVGFFFGFWHGLILPFAFILSLFDDHIAIYAAYNNGGFYNWGFVMGVAAFFNARF